MVTVAVLLDPPRPGVVLPGLAGAGLPPDDRAALYAAAAKDVLGAVADSGGDLLVNYRPDELLPGGEEEGEAEGSGSGSEAGRSPDAEAAVGDLVRDALGADDGVRFEVQVGSSADARAGNTATHLLEREGVPAAVLVDPVAPLLARRHVDSGAMKLRRSEVVLGPGDGGRAYLAAFAESVDFAGACAVPEVDTLAGRARDAGLDVDFLPSLPTVASPSGLAGVVALVRARRRAGLTYPAHTAEVVDDLGLRVVGDGDRRVRPA